MDRNEALAMHRAAQRGDAAATAFWEHLFDPYRDSGVLCFLCDLAINTFPVFIEVIPDSGTNNTVLAAPTCPTCHEMLRTLRWDRCMKLLKAMHKARTGKSVHFVRLPAHYR